MKIFNNVAAMKLATLKAGQFVETGGYYSKGDDGGAKYLVKTAAQAAADGDTIDEIGAGFTLANGNVVVLQFDSYVTPATFGAIVNSSDQSTAILAALASGYRTVVDAGLTYRCLNLAVPTGARLEVNGELKLPAGASDNDSVIKNSGVGDIQIYGTGKIDGDRLNQSGVIQTRLIDFSSSLDRIRVYGLLFQEHYSDEAAAITGRVVSIEGGDHHSIHNCGLKNFSQEGMFIETTNHSSIDNIDMKDEINKSWTTAQISGVAGTTAHNTIRNIRSKNNGASSVNLDSRHSTVSDIVADGVRFQNGVNLGHPGKDSSYSTVTNVVIKDLTDNVNVNSAGLSIVSDSVGVTASSVTIDGSTQRGVNVSSGAKDAQLTDIRCKDVLTALSVFEAGEVSVKGLKLEGAVTNGISKDVGSSGTKTNLLLEDVNLDAATTKFSGSTTDLDHVANVVYNKADPKDAFVSVAGLGAGGTTTVTNENARQDSRIIMIPSNSAGAAAQPYIQSQSDGSFIIGTVNNGSGGAGVRYKIV